MEPVIIMLNSPGKENMDIEVLPDIPAGELAEAIALALGWQGRFMLQFGAKTLAPTQTLADVDAWDGSLLVMKPIPDRLAAEPKVETSPASAPQVTGSPPPSAAPSENPAVSTWPPVQSPVIGWRQPAAPKKPEEKG